MRLSYLQPTNWMYSMRSEWESTPTTESRLEVDIPGLEKKEDVTIKIGNDNVLSISGTINMANEVKDDHMYTQERFTGRFDRSIRLPARVAAEKEAKATYKNGVLEIRMLKLDDQEKGLKQIDVEFH